MARDLYTEFTERCRKSEERIVAEHPRMGEPNFRAALVNSAINENAGWLMREKAKLLGRSK